MPAVSVIMPAYNVEEYLREAAESALNQTFADLELIIVDDGATDQTGAIAEAIRRTDPARVRVLAQPNAGLPAARNTAMRVARGEYLALLDSDDVWEPEFLASQLAVFAASPAVDLVTGNALYLGSRLDGLPVRPCPDRRPEPTLERIIADEEAIFVMTVFRRRVYEAISGFDETLRTNEDYDYWLRAAAAGFRFARNPLPLARYRRRDDSLSASEVRMIAGVLKVYDKARSYCVPGTPARRALDAQLARFEAELELAHARHALSTGDGAAASRALTALSALRPSLKHRLAAFLARHAAPLLTAAYQARRRRRGAPLTPPVAARSPR
ncbi:MAG TPA: glycosyltransferase family A protein [Vicinamibacterales bacterium]|nr:glycosyltransferase family A protein [Vicinamibacterales bacterium]